MLVLALLGMQRQKTLGLVGLAKLGNSGIFRQGPFTLFLETAT